MDARHNWLCPICLSKQPKGDNSGAPVRPSTPTGLAEITFNVTRRKQQAKAGEPLTASTTDPADFVTRSDIKDILRQEMRNITIQPPPDTLRSELRDIVREEVRILLQESIGTLNSTMSVRLTELNEQIGDLRASVNFMSSEFDDMKKSTVTCQNEMRLIKKENDCLRNELNNLSRKLTQIDQLSRASNMEIQCVPEHRSENILNIVKKLGNTVKMPIKDSDVLFCSRIAKQNQESTRPRTILVKLNSPRTRDSILSAVMTYNKQNAQQKLNSSDLGFGPNEKTAVFVTENLSPENKNLHSAARHRAKELKYKFVWVRGGRIYMRKTESSEMIYVRNIDTLNKLK